MVSVGLYCILHGIFLRPGNRFVTGFWIPSFQGRLHSWITFSLTTSFPRVKVYRLFNGFHRIAWLYSCMCL